jgi:hypothetical protein
MGKYEVLVNHTLIQRSIAQQHVNAFPPAYSAKTRRFWLQINYIMLSIKNQA